MRALALLTVLALTAGCATERGSQARPSLVDREPAPPPLSEGADAVVRAESGRAGAPDAGSPDAGSSDAGAGSGTSDAAGVSGTEPPGPGVGARTTSDPVLAWVGGRPVLASELLEAWLQRDSIGLKSAFNVLVSGRLAQLEAERLALRLPPLLVNQSAARNAERLRLRVLGEETEPEDLDAFVREELDLDPVRYRERLRRDTLRELVTERVVRAWTLSNEYARVRMILVSDRDEVAEVLAALEDGRGFADLARERSLDSTGERGGLVPFLLRNDRAPLSRLAFDTPVGEVGGPIELAGVQVLLRVEERPEAVVGDWDTVALTVEDSLLEEPVTDEEWLAWELAMERRYGIDVEPLYDFVGEPYR